MPGSVVDSWYIVWLPGNYYKADNIIIIIITTKERKYLQFLSRTSLKVSIINFN